MSAKLISVDKQHARLSGELTHHTGAELLEQGKRLISAAGAQWTVDLSEVTRSSSVGVALLLGWKRHAENQKLVMDIQNLPDNMLHVMQFSGLEGVFFSQ